ncbi:MAG: replicative DNA helicase, partial [Gemmatimonadetes bacterium]|nr:replicative DNA helicase [Gemmatimonadota bacterium]
MNAPEPMAIPSPPAFDRQPPFSPEAEVSVLGGMLIDRDAVAKAVEVVRDSMFYREANRRLFRAMTRLFERGDVIDVITLSEELKKTEELDAAGGLPYLAELLDAVPTAANIEYHAKIVREKALLRNLIEAASSIIRDVYDQGERQVE